MFIFAEQNNTISTYAEPERIKREVHYEVKGEEGVVNTEEYMKAFISKRELMRTPAG
jgi:hypothetical protein